MPNSDKSYEIVLCMLEIMKTKEAEGKQARVADIADELKRPVDDIEKAVETASKEGWIQRNEDALKLTDKGRLEVKKHREYYIHQKYAHYPGFLGNIGKFFEGKIKDWRGHWHRRHGFNSTALNGFYRNLEDFKGRIEDATPLANLGEGEKGVVAFAMGGYGLIRRLAEMGLTPGVEVTVIRCGLFRGPVEVEVRGVSLALGHGVASKVFVRPSRVKTNEG